MFAVCESDQHFAGNLANQPYFALSSRGRGHVWQQHILQAIDKFASNSATWRAF